MTEEEDGCTLALPPRRAKVLALLLEFRVPVEEALETATTLPDRALRHFVAYREAHADRPGRTRRPAGFTAGRR